MGTANSGRPIGRKFSIVGMHARPGRAVQHVGLLPRDGPVDIGAPVSVYDMGPPLRVEPMSHEANAIPADVLAWLDDLTTKEVDGMEAWIARIRVHLRDRTVSYRYQALPAYEEQLNERGDRLLRRKFSCAGFVEQCYAAAEITLIDPQALPVVDDDLIATIWSRREAWALVGLREDTRPWRVLLPGYLLHAVHGGRSALPYRPRNQDYGF